MKTSKTRPADLLSAAVAHLETVTPPAADPLAEIARRAALKVAAQALEAAAIDRETGARRSFSATTTYLRSYAQDATAPATQREAAELALMALAEAMADLLDNG